MNGLIHSCSTEEIAVKHIKTIEEALDTGSFKLIEQFTSPVFINQQLERKDPITAQESQDKDYVCLAEIDLDGQEVKMLGVV